MTSPMCISLQRMEGALKINVRSSYFKKLLELVASIEIEDVSESRVQVALCFKCPNDNARDLCISSVLY